MASNQLAAIIGLIHRDQAHTVEALTGAFAEDFGHFARSNNRQPLETAVTMLKKGGNDAHIASAITAGYKGANLATGYVGAQSGKYKAQPESVTAVFEAAIVQACDAFKASLVESKAFEPAAKKTDAEKLTAKTEKADKAEKVLNDLITAKIQAGELVRASDVVTGAELGQSAIVDMLVTMVRDNTLSPENMQALRDELSNADKRIKAASKAAAKAAA